MMLIILFIVYVLVLKCTDDSNLNLLPLVHTLIISALTPHHFIDDTDIALHNLHNFG